MHRFAGVAQRRRRPRANASAKPMSPRAAHDGADLDPLEGWIVTA